ncbi:hypothetical protein M427DRAFT_500011 [Gonapodya prolifera JEL478]|uniref:F-box domain-containing protein n=1 Tax=Gonapodya prolifera (strain JEL478) TaxID=1344416 RepID=A0A139AAC5_GONPJ|nr:hypothetical protein M427DRAFT_500011 [Gonapodya prolifera JEL478]|eukprot:KXS13746.1 hypothetical protein M427DRAFT_500011 [Gonapodya prolifera JEL478]
MCPTAITSLPLETLVDIARYMSTRDMVKYAASSSSNRWILNDPSVWQHLDIGAPRGVPYSPKGRKYNGLDKRPVLDDKELQAFLDRIERLIGVSISAVVRTARLSGLAGVTMDGIVGILWKRCPGLVYLEARDCCDADPEDLSKWFMINYEDDEYNSDYESGGSSDDTDRPGTAVFDFRRMDTPSRELLTLMANTKIQHGIWIQAGWSAVGVTDAGPAMMKTAAWSHLPSVMTAKCTFVTIFLT